MKRTRAIQEGYNVQGKEGKGEGAGGDPSQKESVPSLKVHEWGLNPLFWVSPAGSRKITELLT